MVNRTPSSALMLATLAAAQETKPQRDEQAYQSYRTGERNAEAIVAEYQAQHAYQSYRAGERASYEPASQPKSWWQRAGFIRDLLDSLDSLEDAKEFVVGGVTMARGAWRLAFPSRFGSKTCAEVAQEQFMRDVQRGVITEQDIMEELARLPNDNLRWPRMNYTDLAETWEGFRQMSSAGVNLTPLTMQVSGMALENTHPSLARDLQHGGSTLDGVLNLWQGIKQVQGTEWFGELLRSPVGKASIVIQGAVGGYDYVTGAGRLVSDPSLLPGASSHAWTERVGVATQAIGGAFLVAGAVSAFVPGLQPAAPIFLTAGVLFEGAGMIMQNWGWITEKAGQLFRP
ncbi:MAG: hypothetical protein Fur0043_27950 [Anaerolineales bacterium]